MAYHFLGIGLNYTGTQNALQGCINDVNDWARHFGPILQTPSIILTERQATKAGMIAGIRETLRKLTLDDTAIIQYSGHGTHVPSRDDEADGQDEALCPWDMTQNLLLDDEIGVLLADRAKGSRVLFITDCCHSGSMSRAPVMFGPGNEPKEDDRAQPRYVSLSELTDQGMQPATLEQIQSRASYIRGELPLDTGLVHLSGCSDVQFSFDATFNGRSNGAFTYYAIKALQQNLPVGFTCEQWHAMIRRNLPSSRYQQAPEYHAAKEMFVPGFAPPSPPVVIPPATATASVLDGVLSDGRKFRLEIG